MWEAIREVNSENASGCIHKLRTQNFPKNLHFLHPDTHTYVCVSGGRNLKLSGKFAYVLNGLLLNEFNNPLKINLPIIQKPSIDLLKGTNDWFLYDGNIHKWVNVVLTSKTWRLFSLNLDSEFGFTYFLERVRGE